MSRATMVVAARESLGFIGATSAGALLTGTGLVDITSDIAIPAGKMYGLVGSMKYNITGTDDLGIQWTGTGTVTCGIGYISPAGAGGGLAINTASGLIATNGTDQWITFHGTVSGGASGGNFKLQARKNTDAAGDGGVYAGDTGFILCPLN